MIETKIDMVLIGTPRPFREDGEMSAISKMPVNKPLLLDYEGLDGNQVADPVHHGGTDKAIHFYPVEHYAFWREKYPDLDLLNRPGAFGENISCTGLTEDSLCLGDVFRIGNARIECSHARQPCWKLNHHFGQADVLKSVVKTGKSGSYFRILEPGEICVGDRIIQEDRPYPQWTLERLFGMIIGGKHKGQGSALLELAAIDELAETWRKRAFELAKTQSD